MAPWRLSILAASVVAALVLLSSCSSRSGSWRIRFESTVQRSATRRVEARVRRDTCDGPEVWTGSIAAGAMETGSPIPALATGTFAFEAVALDETCRPIARGCEIVSAPPGDIVVLLRAADGPPLCDSAQCQDGACRCTTDCPDASVVPDTSPDASRDAPAVADSADAEMPSACGNGTLDEGEVCDDGNTNGGDGCLDCRPECELDIDCGGNPCLGIGRCEINTNPAGRFGACVDDSTPLDCGDPTCARCDRTMGCVPSPSADADFDGFASLACGGDDCDDSRFEINPGRVEECDPEMLDVNCVPDDEPTSTDWFADCDGDGYAAASASSLSSCGRPTTPPMACGPSGSWTSRTPATGSLDCVDGNADVFPGQRDFFRTGHGSDLSFDYDCDGRDTARYGRALTPMSAPCGTARCEDQAPVLDLTTACGELATLYFCSSACTRYAATARYYLECR